MSKLTLIAVFCIGLIAATQASPSGRIVGGVDATEGQFPHQISLRRNGSHTCGGSIISRNYILTAAHCVGAENENGEYVVYPPEMFSIRAGSTNRLSGGVVLQVVDIRVHEAYESLNNDVALLKLESPLIFSSNIRAIPLASAEIPPGGDVVVSGWGRLKTNGDIPIKLQWNTLEALSKTRCATSIFMYTDSLICLAHSRGNGACNGDSGGPAIYNGEVVGIAGFVMGGCGSFLPDGYAKVYYHRDWIIRNTDL